MRIVVISPGKIREKWLQAGIAEYVKRLGRYTQVDLQTVDDMPDSWPADKALEEEGRRLLARLRPQSFVIALDLHGQEFDSIELASRLPEWFRLGSSEIIFIIGGSNGLSQAVLKRAQVRLCLSRMTMTHQMTRLFLLEQCYRTFKIANNEPYHK